ncbi:MAG: preprotein translocase subunit Sec61beta [Thermoproteaceae archaeon]|nr:preprotein translocase subunit Sec61beta [Thermoproteaceae archaeon]
MARRRRYEGLNPFVAAGLIKFSEEGELERIRLTPRAAVIISVAIAAALMALSMLTPPA